MTDALSRLEQLNDDELDALVDIAQARASGAVSRRDLLKTGGALAALGLGGGAAVGSASADASTSDDDGNVGRPSDRYDGFFDGVDANSVSTGQLSYNVEDGADISATRSTDTEYQNTNDYTLWVIATLEHNPSSGTDTNLNAELRMSSTSGLDGTTKVDRAAQTGVDGGEATDTVKFPVPPGHYYEVKSFGDETIEVWYERGLV